MTEPGRDSVVSLREITAETLRPILKLSVTPEQESFVAPNSVSIAEAHFANHAWFRGIYADDTAVGFVMLSLQPDKPHYYLWRFMLDHRYQRLGFGRRAMKQVIDFVRQQPRAGALILSYVRAEGGPGDFYAGLGFFDTNEEHDGEWVMRLEL